jgi:hypothetical protein
VVRGRRYPLAMGRVRAKQTMDYGLGPLLARLGTGGMRRKLLRLDRGFYSVRVIQALLTCELPCIMPAVHRGKKPPTAGGPTGTDALAETTHGPWPTYPLPSAQEGHGAFDLAVVCTTRGANEDVTSARPCCMLPGA